MTKKSMCNPYIEKIFIDDREGSRIEYALKEYSSLSPSVTHLDVGDYIFQSIEDENGKIEEVVFEYKTASDFINSLDDNRLYNQAYHMVTNYDYTFVMIEAEDLRKTSEQLYYETGKSVPLSRINGAITTLNTESTVIIAQSRKQAFDLMLRMAVKIFQHKPIRFKYGKKSTNPALNFLRGIRGVDKRAERICRELELTTLLDLLDLDKKTLMTVKGVGEGMADKIIMGIGGYSWEMKI